ncbi:hypothetical protein DDI_0068 [Dickeya dianthicola RNS04.9]|nr:hypothetical protein DDI_0068 [Dickeya dianthicola RNS04.9]
MVCAKHVVVRSSPNVNFWLPGSEINAEKPGACHRVFFRPIPLMEKSVLITVG